MNAELTLSVIVAILRYGPKAILAIAEAFKNSDPTAEDIKQLFIAEDPEDYFK